MADELKFDAPSPERDAAQREGISLADLCRQCGIEPEYQDVFGRTHRISPDTARAILGAMGIRLNGQMLEEVVASQERLHWSRRLEPVRVVSADQPAHALVRLPEDAARQPLEYALTLESGEALTRAARPAELELHERRDIDGRAHAAYALPLPAMAPGYHRLTVAGIEGGTSIVAAPAACYLPQAIAGDGRAWGVGLQLYGLRSERNWGIGDFTDLTSVLGRVAEQGGAFAGVNPLHALYPHAPAHVSPYSPSSRMFLNVLYLDVENIAEFSQCASAQRMVYAPEFQQRLTALRAAEHVDYPGVAAAKLPVLELLYGHFCEHHLARSTPRARMFREFQARAGAALERHALFEALAEHFGREDPQAWGWSRWPEAYRSPEAPAVAEWARAHRDRVEYYQYLQWQADRQLGLAGSRSAALGLGVGIYQDLAVGVDPGGAETWGWQAAYARGVGVGAPPDIFSPNGQNWGLLPLTPQGLREAAYLPFIETLRENMRHAGALRLDHVMGLQRLFWVPAGMAPKDGAYVRYPLTDLLGIVALESSRNRCLVIGEDLGTVPAEIQREMPARRMLSYRVFYFEQNAQGDFKPPETYPNHALAAVTTHDLPTLAGFWKGVDLTERERMRLFPSEETRTEQTLARAQDRARLLLALSREQLLPEGVTVDPASSPDMTPALTRAVHAYLARTPAKIVLVQLEDLLGEPCQPNLPGAGGHYPNWRRKLGLALDAVFRDARAAAVFGALRDQRGSGVVQTAPRRERAPIPRATYRLQFHREFTFRDAAALAPYLARLGISHCYASPYLKARPGSTHGYDIVDHNALNPEIGSSTDYDAFLAALHAGGLGQVLDIVPNHMGIGADNPWWLDVLENGPASVHAPFFDIDWRPLKAELRGKVQLPVLGDHYGRVLARGELALVWDPAAGAFHVAYYDHRFPLDPATYPRVLARTVAALEQALGAGTRHLVEYQSLLDAFARLPARDDTGRERVIERKRDKELHKTRLAELAAAEPALAREIERAVAQYNSGGEQGWTGLHDLLERQAYRLAFWRVASDEINYRRFFDINDLAALRMEFPQTFYATHRLISDLIADGKVNGLRIDHPDGMYDPRAYYERLQSFVTEALLSSGKTSVPGNPLYVVVEKILASHEQLPGDWPVHGTTGYEFLNLVNGLFVDASAEKEMGRIYAQFSRREHDFDALLAERKRLITRVTLSSELNVLASRLDRLAEADWDARDFTLDALREALREVVAYFPVYRTYIEGTRVTAEDRRYIEWAVARAKRESRAADASVYDFVGEILLLENLERRPASYRAAAADFAARFQQYTAPVMAKGLEDTTFYIYHRLVSLNEVGGDPRRFGVSVGAFHRANLSRLKRFPHSMLASSTHDTKRSEDVRARIDVLTELPAEWRAAVNRWGRINRRKKRKLDDGYAPDRNDEYLVYQTLAGVWPLEALDDDTLARLRERIESYLLKALREAKVHTSWVNPNAEYEQAAAGFVRGLLAPGGNLFLKDFVPFVQRLLRPGLVNSLAQTLVKLTAPGVPDIYQGNELWDFSLVDPDNRRPVHYARRLQLLERLEAELARPAPAAVRRLLGDGADGRAKLYLVWKALSLRRAQPALFRDGDYLPLAVEGACAQHLCAYGRGANGANALVVVPRLTTRLADGNWPLGEIWADTRIEAPVHGVYANIVTGEVQRTAGADSGAWLRAADVLRSFPVALLTNGTA